jgi:hypothetical protein
MSEQISQEQLDKETDAMIITMGGSGNGGSNATDLINLLTIKTAKELRLDLGGVGAAQK